MVRATTHAWWWIVGEPDDVTASEEEGAVNVICADRLRGCEVVVGTSGGRGGVEWGSVQETLGGGDLAAVSAVPVQ